MTNYITKTIKNGVEANIPVTSVNWQYGDVVVAWKEYNAWEWITIWATHSDMQWPAPDGFHVPLTTEWQWLKTIMDWLGLTTSWDDWRINLHMPFAGGRRYNSASPNDQGSIGRYWSSSPYVSGSTINARHIYLDSSSVFVDNNHFRVFGFSVRCFKDSFELPTSSWAVINGTLWSAWIFWNQTEWLISITDWTTGYTIMDKNLWATTVYNNWDTLSEANCGKYYQWGNNYWFAWTWSITTSSTQVDASNYWPNTANWYYESDTFIIGNSTPYDWSSVHNDNLRWWETQWTWIWWDWNTITNTGVLSVNGQTGDVTTATVMTASEYSQVSNPVAGKIYFIKQS